MRYVWRSVLRAWRTAAACEAPSCMAQQAVQQAHIAWSSTPAGRAVPAVDTPGAQAQPGQQQLPAVPVPEMQAAGADRRPGCISRAGWGVTAAAATCSAAPATPLHAYNRAKRGLVLGRLSAEGGVAGSAVRPLSQGEGAEFAAAEVVLAAAEAALGRTVSGGSGLRGRLPWQSPSLAM